MTRPAGYQAARGERQIVRVVAALQEKPMTTEQLCAELFLSRASIGIYVRRLRTAPKRVYICKFAAQPNVFGRRAPVFALGTYPDAKEPHAKTTAEKFKKLKSDKERHNLRLAKRRADTRIKSVMKTANPWYSALFIGVKTPPMNAEG
jgi:hypothetical protein